MKLSCIFSMIAVQSYLFFGIAMAQEKSFSAKIEPTVNGSIELDPKLPEDGKYKEGSIVTARAKPQDGYALDSVYYAIPGRWGSMFHESLTPEFKIRMDQDKSIGASFIKNEEVDHVRVKHNIVYAKPGLKKLKYDVYSPKSASQLPIIVIIHGGGWSSNDEDIMRGLARELTKGGKFVVCSMDYRWVGKLDGDEKPNSMANLIEDVFGAIAHIMEHANEFGGDASCIGVTGDSAGGHLSASAAMLIEKIGAGGFAEKEGIYEFKPTYVPQSKTVEVIRSEMLASIKAAAPSYGVFATQSLAGFQRGMSQDAADATAPQSHIPEASKRSVPHYLTRGTRDNLISDEAVASYADALKAKGHTVVYDQIEGAGHAFFDWKPNDRVKATFAQYGVPYAEKMKAFFEQHLHKQ